MGSRLRGARHRFRPALAALLALAGSACGDPKLGAHQSAPVAAQPPTIALSSATVDGSGRVVATYLLLAGSAPIAPADAASLRPTFTLAALGTDPVSGLDAWESLVLTGAQVIPSNPVGGPGTPPASVIAGQRQPGPDAGGTTESLGEGVFRYTFASPLPAGFDGSRTVRVGVWLEGATPTASTAATLDLVPAGGTPRSRELVVDAACNACHGLVVAHGHRTGTGLCLACHTLQNADPDTVDPAALDSATPATNPNPLDLGRLLHRIHRGNELPTLAIASSTAPAPPLASGATLPLPYLPGRNIWSGGRRYSVVDEQQREVVFGGWRAILDASGLSDLATEPIGVELGADLRTCDACHGGAAQAALATTAISRRTCAGCHPDVWFQADPITDPHHFSHPGGPVAFDVSCADCHVSPGAFRLYADVAQVHVPAAASHAANPMGATLAAVTSLRPGQRPTVVFTLYDRDGSLTPLNDPANLPSPANDAASPVPRAVTHLAVTLAGPTAPDILTGNVPLTEPITAVLAADAQGRFTYTLATALPAGASGTWTVVLEATRQLPQAPFYDPANDRFSWPYTGEPLTEAAANAVAYVDVAAGATGAGSPVPRRTVVDLALCNACHGALSHHDGARNRIEACVACHTPDATDWSERPKLQAGEVALAQTADGIEERSLRFGTLIHRIHTGAATGTAQLDGGPLVVYQAGVPRVFAGRYPADLGDCRRCHAGETFTIEAMAAGEADTVANETPTIQHQGTPAHGAGEPRIPPITAACTSCHDTGTAHLHAASHTSAGEELCAGCHGAGGTASEYSAHGLTAPP